MLQVSFLRDEKERVLEGLKKRNFKNLELVAAAIKLDDDRKKTQQELDAQLSEINKISKEIGLLMKDGKKEEAENIKSQVQKINEELVENEKLEEKFSSLGARNYKNGFEGQASRNTKSKIKRCGTNGQHLHISFWRIYINLFC